MSKGPDDVPGTPYLDRGINRMPQEPSNKLPGGSIVLTAISMPPKLLQHEKTRCSSHTGSAQV